MNKDKLPPRKRGRPPSGKKGYFIRMFPATHDTLLKIAEDQSTDLCGLFDILTNDWKSKMKFARLEDATVNRPDVNSLCLIYELKEALKSLQPRIKYVPRHQFPDAAWLDVCRDFERTAKAFSDR